MFNSELRLLRHTFTSVSVYVGLEKALDTEDLKNLCTLWLCVTEEPKPGWLHTPVPKQINVLFSEALLLASMGIYFKSSILSHPQQRRDNRFLQQASRRGNYAWVIDCFRTNGCMIKYRAMR